MFPFHKRFRSFLGSTDPFSIDIQMEPTSLKIQMHQVTSHASYIVQS